MELRWNFKDPHAAAAGQWGAAAVGGLAWFCRLTHQVRRERETEIAQFASIPCQCAHQGLRKLCLLRRGRFLRRERPSSPPCSSSEGSTTCAAESHSSCWRAIQDHRAPLLLLLLLHLMSQHPKRSEAYFSQSKLCNQLLFFSFFTLPHLLSCRTWLAGALSLLRMLSLGCDNACERSWKSSSSCRG